VKAQDLRARVERERAAHTEEDVLGRSIEVKNRFPHIWTYPGRVRLASIPGRHLDSSVGDRILDLGCGRGERALEMLRGGARVVGIDISPAYIEAATSAARAVGHSDTQFDFIAADAHQLPFPDESFDFVLGEGILHHLQLETALSEVHRVLRPGGRALFLEPLLDNPMLKIFRLLTPTARTPDERPLSRSDLNALDVSAKWKVESSYCGLLTAPVAMITSVLLRPYPNNVLLRAADRFERVLNRMAWIRPLNQYVLLDLVRK